MAKRWFSFTHAYCQKCGGSLEVKAEKSFRFSLGDEIKCLGCPATGSLTADDQDVDSVNVRWNE